METKIQLGKSVSGLLNRVLYDSLWISVRNSVRDSVNHSVGNSVNHSVGNSVERPINNSTRWRIEL